MTEAMPVSGASPKWLMGIDIGAGSLKTMVIDSSGKVHGSAAVDIFTHSPKPRWSEQDPQDWWRAVCETVPLALSQAGIQASEIAGISFSAGAHTPVLEDERGNLVRPAILWNDQRSGEESRELQDRHGERILALGLNRPAPTWTMPQFLWLVRNEPESVKKTTRVYIAKDWLRSRLTGTWETDRTEAVGTLLFDTAKDAWSPELCGMAQWNIDTLPPLVTPTTVIGKVTAKAAAECGLAEGTPVVCGTSDTSVETFGAGSISPGDGTIKLATAGTVSVVTDKPQVHPTLINYPLAVPGLWYVITGTNSCASAHRWFRDQFVMTPNMSGSDAFDEMDRLAGATARGADGLLFHPYLQGERAPYWDPMLRADFVGMTFRHTKAHFSRAVYEGIAFSLRDVLEQFRTQGMGITTARIIGGGSKSAVWRQIVADILNVEVLLPETTDASFGAALLAGVGVGVFADEISAARICTRIVDRSLPDPVAVAFYEKLFRIYKNAQAGLQEVNHALSRMSG